MFDFKIKFATSIVYVLELKFMSIRNQLKEHLRLLSFEMYFFAAPMKYPKHIRD